MQGLSRNCFVFEKNRLKKYGIFARVSDLRPFCGGCKKKTQKARKYIKKLGTLKQVEETVVCHAGRSTAQMWVWRKHEKCAKQQLCPFARAEEVSNFCVQNKSKTTYPRKISRLKFMKKIDGKTFLFLVSFFQ